MEEGRRQQLPEAKMPQGFVRAMLRSSRSTNVLSSGELVAAENDGVDQDDGLADRRNAAEPGRIPRFHHDSIRGRRCPCRLRSGGTKSRLARKTRSRRIRWFLPCQFIIGLIDEPVNGRWGVAHVRVRILRTWRHALAKGHFVIRADHALAHRQLVENRTPVSIQLQRIDGFPLGLVDRPDHVQRRDTEQFPRALGDSGERHRPSL